MHLDVRSVSRQAEHPRQFDRLPGDRRRLPPGHREPRLAEKPRRAGRRGPCPPRYPAVVLFLRKGRPAAVPSWPAGRTRWITVVPGAGTPAAAARRTLTATAPGGSSPSRTQRARGPALAGAGPGHLAVQACYRRSRVPGGPGDRLVPVGGPAQRHGGATPAARARASRTSPRAVIAAAPDGGPGKAAELRLLDR